MSAPTDVFRCHFDGRNWWGRMQRDVVGVDGPVIHLFLNNPYEQVGEWARLSVPAHMVEVTG